MGRGQAGVNYSESYFIQFLDGRSGIYTTLTGTWQPFALIVITTKNTYQIKMDPMRLYDALIEQIAHYMEGKPNRLVPMEAVLESVEIMLAGSASRAKGGIPVQLCQLTDKDPSFDGTQFWKEYRAASGPMYALESR